MPSYYGSPLLQSLQKVEGVEIYTMAPSNFDPLAGARFNVANKGSKLLRVVSGGETYFLEPGERVTVPADPVPEIRALNNGV